MPLRLSQRIAVFSELGSFFRHFTNPSSAKKGFLGDVFTAKFLAATQKAHMHNGWFDDTEVRFAIRGWGELLQEEALASWTRNLPEENQHPKTIGIVMAGNLPLVGFHDLLSVLISGHKAHVKMSKDDQQLLPVIFEMLYELAPEWRENIAVVPRLNSAEAVIATGSNNSTRYFNHYFGAKPNIIRGSRNSLAVIKNTVTDQELTLLGNDIFRYYGLGCRSVSKLYLPHDFDLNRVFGALMPHSEVVMNKKYGNNYDYHRAIYMMNKIPFLENGFVLLRESDLLHSPVAVVHYERYTDIAEVAESVSNQEAQIQCVVADHDFLFPRRVDFGKAQQPTLTDYADGVDTLQFLKALNR